MSRTRRKSTPQAPSAARRPERPPARHRWLLGLGAALLLTFLVYLPSLDNDFTTWDDNFYVTRNPLLSSPNLEAILTTPIAGNYHPLTIASFVVNYRLSRLDPASYHWLNLLIHLANTALVFVFVWMLSKGRFWTTVVTSTFFGIHPMHVESVAWIAERKDVLYSFFYLLGLIVYLRYLDRGRIAWLGCSFLAFVLSAASKPAAIVFPATLLAIDYFRKRPFRRSVFLEKLPFVAVAVATGLLTLHAQRTLGATAYQWAWLEKLAFGSYGTLMYVVKLFLPFGLSALYPYPSVALRHVAPKYYLAMGVLLITVPLVIYLFRRVRPVLFGIAFFFINIALVLQFFTVGGAIMADRYTYLPYIGLFFALAWWLDERTGPRSPRLWPKRIVAACLLLLVPICLFQTWKRCDVWANTETLWADTFQKYPGQSVDAHVNRGEYYYERGRREEALADFNQALALNPSVAKVWVMRGNILSDMNQPDSALVCYEQALRLKPNFAEALNNRGGLQLRRGNIAQALADITRAIELIPRYRDAYANRAVAYTRVPDYGKAVADFREAIEIEANHPKNGELYDAIGVCLQRLNRLQEAVAAHDESIRLTPADDPRLAGYYLNRSYAWRALGDRARALADLREARRLGARVDPAFLRELGG